MRARFYFSYCLIGAACSASTELASVQQAICNCNQDPVPCCCNSPILVDVAGNGFELTSLDDGVTVATRPGYQQTERAWTRPGSDDAWLVLDRSGDGVINDMSEMFGNTTPQADPPEGERRNGFLALALYDDNGDAVIDERDPIFGSLRLWQDKNHDGVSQPDELHKPPELGVAGISVTYTEARRGDGNGNLFLYRASVYGTPGSNVGKDAWDVWLSGVQSMPIPGGKAAAHPRVSDPASTSSATLIGSYSWSCSEKCDAVWGDFPTNDPSGGSCSPPFGPGAYGAGGYTASLEESLSLAKADCVQRANTQMDFRGHPCRFLRDLPTTYSCSMTTPATTCTDCYVCSSTCKSGPSYACKSGHPKGMSEGTYEGDARLHSELSCIQNAYYSVDGTACEYESGSLVTRCNYIPGQTGEGGC